MTTTPLEDNRHSHGGNRHDHPGGSTPHDHTTPPRKRTGPITGVVIGGLLLLARLVVPAIPVSGTSLGEANSVCTGALGAFVKGFGGQQVVRSCNEVTSIMLALNLAAFTGLALVITCGALLFRRR
jgi:hypothetical protein